MKEKNAGLLWHATLASAVPDLTHGAKNDECWVVLGCFPNACKMVHQQQSWAALPES